MTKKKIETYEVTKSLYMHLILSFEGQILGTF